jgi:hypothetical protein
MPTNPPNITALPSPPDPNDRSTFNARAYPWSVAQQTLATEVTAVAANVKGNADEAVAAAGVAGAKAAEALASQAAAAASAASALNAPGTTATSASSLAVGAGLKSLTLAQTGKAFAVGQRVVIARTSAASTVRMVGYLEAADPAAGTLIARVGPSDYLGSGTYSDWSISMAGEGNNLPNPGAPDIGKMVVVTGAGQYGLGDSRGGGGALSSGNVTLTAASAAVQKITGGTPGQWVQLPDATTLPLGVGLYSLTNNTGIDLELRDATGTIIGFARPNATVVASLGAKTSAAGVWALSGAASWGVLNVGLNLADYSAVLQSVTPIDSGRDLFLIGTAGAVYGVVWDSVNCVFGTLAMVRSAAVATHSTGATARAVKLATDKMLVACVTNNLNSAVVLTISGTTITVGTAATLALGAKRLCDLVAVDGVGAAMSYTNTSDYGYVVHMTVSGTAVTLGTPYNLAGGQVILEDSMVPLYDLGSNRVLVFYHYGTTTALPLTVSGANLSPGTSVNGLSNNPWTSIRRLSSGRFAVIGINTYVTGTLVSVAGTVASISGGATLSNNAGQLDAAIAFGNQVLVAMSAGSDPRQSYNVLTDNAGVALVGTELLRANSSSAVPRQSLLGYDANSITMLRSISNNSLAQAQILRVGISGNSPVLLSARSIYGTDQATGGAPVPLTASTAGGWHFGKDTLPVGVIAGPSVSLDLTSIKALMWVTEGAYTQLEPRAALNDFRQQANSSQQCRGGSDSQQWISSASTNSAGSWVILQRIKAA